MEVEGAAEFGEEFAEIYDLLPSSMYNGDASECVEMLAELSRSSSILELGVGTGRIALPLSARCPNVTVVDSSQKMLDSLRSKVGSDRLRIVGGDLASVKLGERFGLIYILCNTIFCLLTQDEQLKCFRNARKMLTDDGLFVVETFVGTPQPTERSWSLDRHVSISDDSVILSASRANANDQILEQRTIYITNRGIKLLTSRLRFALPAELDLMGRLAGLEMVERWSGWKRQPFLSESNWQIAVYRPQNDRAS